MSSSDQEHNKVRHSEKPAAQWNHSWTCSEILAVLLVCLRNAESCPGWLKLAFKWQQCPRNAWLAPGGDKFGKARPGWFVGCHCCASAAQEPSVLLTRFCSPPLLPLPGSWGPSQPHLGRAVPRRVPRSLQVLGISICFWRSNQELLHLAENLPSFPFLMYFLLEVSVEGNAAK